MNTLDDIDFSKISPPSFSSRFLSVLIDILIMGVLTICFSFISLACFNNSSYSKNTAEVLKNEGLVCYRMSEESHLMQFDGKGEGYEHYSSRVDQNKIFTNNVYSHILLSFNTDNSYFVSKGITILDIDKSIKPADFENDEITYYFYDFVKNKNEEYSLVDLSTKSYQQYHYDLFKKYQVNGAWVFNNVGDFPMLTGEYAYKAYIYLKSSNPGTENEEAYQALSDQYSSMWNEEYTILNNSPVYKLHFDKYQSVYKEMVMYVDLLLVLSFVIGFIIGYILPSILLKGHRTLGKKAEYIYIVSIKGSKPKKRQVISRAVLKIFPYFGFAIIPYFIFGLFNSSWTTELFTIGSMGISLRSFNIIFLILAAASLCVCIINQNKRSLADLICKTRLIDYREYLDECKDSAKASETQSDENDSSKTNEALASETNK